MDGFYNKHYMLLDSKNNITDGWSDGPSPEKDISQAICINEQGSYQFRLTPNGTENPSLFDENGLSLYKYEDGGIIPKTAAELKIENILQQNKNIASYQDTAIAKSKVELAAFLASHPYQWVDGNLYTVTEDKQTLLTSQLALYVMNQDTILHWNAQGQPCTVWEPADLITLAQAIAEYVRPYVTYQQEKEVEMRACETVEELSSVVVNYETLE